MRKARWKIAGVVGRGYCRPAPVRRMTSWAQDPANDPSDRKRDPLLFTPGPLMTSLAVKQAMIHDFGSRDATFIDIVRKVRKGILGVAQVNNNEYSCIIMQGSGLYYQKKSKKSD
jgi:hypothetical protein